MKKSLITLCLFIMFNVSGGAPLKNRVIMHQLQDNLDTLLAEVGADNVNQAKNKIRHLNKLLGYLQAQTVSDAIKKIKETEARVYEQEKQNEELIAENKSLASDNKHIIAHADSMRSTLQEIIETRNEYARNHQTHIDIFSKIPNKLPKIKKK